MGDARPSASRLALFFDRSASRSRSFFFSFFRSFWRRCGVGSSSCTGCSMTSGAGGSSEASVRGISLRTLCTRGSLGSLSGRARFGSFGTRSRSLGGAFGSAATFSDSFSTAMPRDSSNFEALASFLDSLGCFGSLRSFGTLGCLCSAGETSGRDFAGVGSSVTGCAGGASAAKISCRFRARSRSFPSLRRFSLTTTTGCGASTGAAAGARAGSSWRRRRRGASTVAASTSASAASLAASWASARFRFFSCFLRRASSTASADWRWGFEVSRAPTAAFPASLLASACCLRALRSARLTTTGSPPPAGASIKGCSPRSSLLRCTLDSFGGFLRGSSRRLSCGLLTGASSTDLSSSSSEALQARRGPRRLASLRLLR
mmetsp:Transcript_26845/g.46609  ORF Transcript_26845/g.46609 Transcript_26845/m.46609 type:complete len:375 (+) Transcript_26845:1783-2907(+)